MYQFARVFIAKVVQVREPAVEFTLRRWNIRLQHIGAGLGVEDRTLLGEYVGIGGPKLIHPCV